MLGLQPLEGVPVHAFGLDAFAVQGARLPAQFVAERVRFSNRAVMACFALARIRKPVAVTTSEDRPALLWWTPFSRQQIKLCFAIRNEKR